MFASVIRKASLAEGIPHSSEPLLVAHMADFECIGHGQLRLSKRRYIRVESNRGLCRRYAC